MKRLIIWKNVTLRFFRILIIGAICSPTFAFYIENENSLGGEDDFLYVQIAKLNTGDIFDDHKCLNNGNPNVEGQILFASDLPYGASLDLTQNITESGTRMRLCMSVNYQKSHFKVAFNDNPACILKFHFRDRYGYINEYGSADAAGIGPCNLAYQYEY